MKDDLKGEGVEISREAVATLAAQAASAVPGVAACQQKTVESITSRVKREFVHKGVKVEREDGSYRLSVYLRVCYGVNLPSLAYEVARKVKDYVEGLTEVAVDEVEVVIEDVEMPD
ncbi:MAG: hypothetical protein A2V52_02030 [Actinobacteria bacterium RBG_19FT_COMBO_54_7]|uniref:Asp23/Gls24 family envelope stress response protein n=1 Tax=Candidatus Solincola sediminis TaxID=1797199 RepID=A0A1F2WRE0_9ACTN|nr:MAG: hypothetical protein A2Y75_10985 [Candidatus Solincola sediminis]OFW60270.1 MAG: hypothetical protein A2W01_09080 [Candidatus Solincola sediminis]OFW70531.1 MAG: hypothetical protein A2V52_02030 [Actinobacteria bacterium RBG_19FT_COMBO_54_7]